MDWEALSNEVFHSPFREPSLILFSLGINRTLNGCRFSPSPLRRLPSQT